LVELIVEMNVYDKQISSNMTLAEWDEYFKRLGPDAPVQSIEQLLATGEYLFTTGTAMKFVLMTAKPFNQTAYNLFQAKRTEIQNYLQSILTKYDVSMLLYPNWNQQPWDLSNKQKNKIAYCMVSSSSGWPSINFPIGFTYNDDMPIGITALAPNYQESLLYQFAYSWEKLTYYRQPSSILPEPEYPV